MTRDEVNWKRVKGMGNPIYGYCMGRTVGEKSLFSVAYLQKKEQTVDVLISSDTFSSFVTSNRQPVECFFN